MRGSNYCARLTFVMLSLFNPWIFPVCDYHVTFPEHFSWLYEIDRPVAHAYVASDVLYESQPAKTMRMLASSEFDPLRQVILAESLPRQTTRTTGGEANIIRYENNNVLINASLQISRRSCPDRLLLSGLESFCRRQAEQNPPSKLFFSRSRTRRGDHVVEFKYEPLSFRIGSTVSLSTLFLCAVISLFQILRQRKRLSEANDAPARQPLAVRQE